MTRETLVRANENRKERLEKISQYNHISKMHDRTSDNDIICLDKNCTTDQRIYPTVEEFRAFLRTIRDRLNAEITALDKEFENM